MLNPLSTQLHVAGLNVGGLFVGVLFVGVLFVGALLNVGGLFVGAKFEGALFVGGLLFDTFVTLIVYVQVHCPLERKFVEENGQGPVVLPVDVPFPGRQKEDIGEQFPQAAPHWTLLKVPFVFTVHEEFGNGDGEQAPLEGQLLETKLRPLKEQFAFELPLHEQVLLSVKLVNLLVLEAFTELNHV